MPAICQHVQLPSGQVALVRRSVPKCAYCHRAHTRLCDHEIAGGKTCDRRMCDLHAKRTGSNRDLCQEHR